MSSRPSLDFSGVFTALVTPFEESGAINYDKLRDLVEFQITEGVQGVVPMGTTGESPTVTAEEYDEILKTVVAQVAGRVLVVAGTGTNNTITSVAKTQRAKELGVDATLLVNPYYNKPSQEGMFRHVQAVAEVGLPIMLYNIPGRCGIALTCETVVRMYNEIPMVVAIKEATGSLDLATEISSLCDITILSGDDVLTLPLIAIGAKGVVSVLSNLDPARMLSITQPALHGDFITAAKNHRAIFKLCKTMFIDSNPVPVKAAMSLQGRCPIHVRAPLAPASEEVIERVRGVMQEYKYSV